MKTLFIDFDGTICHDRFWQSLPKTENKQIQDFLFTFNNSLVINWMKGDYTSEEINELVANETGLAYEYLWDIFVSDCKRMQVPIEILNTIRELKNQFHVVLITGNMDCFTRFTAPSLKLHQYFDVIVNSYDEKMLKTENNGCSFTKYLKGDIKDSILIEDSKKSCEVFIRLGGTALNVAHNADTLGRLHNLTQVS